MAKYADSRSGATSPLFSFPYYSYRNISAPEDTLDNRKVGIGQAPLSSVLGLPTDENVRQYLVDADGKERRALTGVHRAIKNTLLTRPELFSVLNGGIVIVAKQAEVDESSKVIKLTEPSIINGSQTQGVITDLWEAGELPANTHIKFELIVTDVAEVISEISISRNYQNQVASISIAGSRGRFREIEEAMRTRSGNQDLQLRKSETDLSDKFIDTEKLLQVIAALIPQELWFIPEESDNPNKAFTYNMKARCLKLFDDIYSKAHSTNATHQDKALYQFYLDIAYDAFELYKKWKKHPGFKRIKGVKNHRVVRVDGIIEEIPDGIVFPILSALSAFIVNDEGNWRLSPPKQFDEDTLVGTALTVYREIAGGNPQTMGKTRACYTSLNQITSIYKQLFSK